MKHLYFQLLRLFIISIVFANCKKDVEKEVQNQPVTPIVTAPPETTLPLVPGDTGFIQNKVIAHRGAFKASGLPQNSIAALKHAIAIGCEASEFDVHLTIDKVLVINHDPTFFGLSIEKSTYDQLLTKTLANGEKIPTLISYLEEGMKQKRTSMMLEIKPSVAGRSMELTDSVMSCVKLVNAQKWLYYTSFDYNILKRILEKDSSARVMFNLAIKHPTATPEQMLKDRFYGVCYQYDVLKKNEGLLLECESRNMPICGWVPNDIVNMQWLLDKKVRFITTDDPELLLKTLPK